MSVTECGMSILVNELQLAKAPGLINVTESGIFIFTKERQAAKAKSPILVTAIT